MCPLCLTATGLYVAGGLSSGAVGTILVTRILRKRILPNRPEAAESPTRAEAASDRHAYTGNRVEQWTAQWQVGRSHER
jgi:hypothetical protein